MIYARLAAGQEVEQATQPHLAEMAREGLRTLCLGQRDIPDKEYQVCHAALGLIDLQVTSFFFLVFLHCMLIWLEGPDRYVWSPAKLHCMLCSQHVMISVCF